MLDIATAYNKYSFLGNEFLTWLWFMVETGQDITQAIESRDPVSLDIGNSLVLENSLGDNAREKITIKGDQAGLEEGTTALKKGAKVTEMNLICKLGPEEEYHFTLKGDSFNITGLKTPAAAGDGSDDEIEGRIIEKALLLVRITQVIDTLFFTFLKQRTADDWKHKGFDPMRTWIYND
ncbi:MULTISPECIES: hypothetical protein [Desulfotignum]|jgi:hypothetical protein|uniref:Uncharacterized protein n=1 Tax=Desulfotignum phosphitoxidans DSM 13687 TaxID=1286635 RepID=S0G420_9BACT|nr:MULTISPECIES: hypothetical protein [Desulfotignum]EMS79047.1 hypothetical protein Dpo_6c02460 [Desulfotignum phosphitoxidans DSM 13687]